jgi:hypothetical protein
MYFISLCVMALKEKEKVLLMGYGNQKFGKKSFCCIFNEERRRGNGNCGEKVPKKFPFIKGWWYLKSLSSLLVLSLFAFSLEFVRILHGVEFGGWKNFS